MKILLITLLMTLFFSNGAYACKCFNQDAHDLYKQSDLVVLGSPSEGVENDKQYIRINSVLKGDINDVGVYLSQQGSSCRRSQLPLIHDREYLLFISSEGDENKLVTKCYNYSSTESGLFDLRLTDDYANVHRNMLGTFFTSQGHVPDISFHISHTRTDTSIKTILGIQNLSDQDIEIFDPSNRNAYTFVLVDADGNLVTPQGSAKVDPKGGILRISQGGVYNYQIESQNVSLPYLSNTARFGYQLEKNKQYRAHVMYRPYGGTYGATASREQTVRY